VVTDYAWWDQRKAHNQHLISMLKENSVATFVEAIHFDEKNDINSGIEGHSLYEIVGVCLKPPLS
jgi:hypothetical protein